MSNLFLSGIQMLPVLQAVSATTTSSSSHTLSSFAFTNSAVTITPKFTTSKFLIIATANMGASLGWATIYRGGSNLFGANGQAVSIWSTPTQWFGTSIIAYDAPGTTSAVTYTVATRSGDGNSILWGIFSTQIITVLEFAG